MKDLGLQTLQAVSSSTTPPMEKLADLVQSFPLHASLVSTIKVSEDIREEVQRFWMSGVTSQAPINSVYINGQRTDLGGATFNVYDLLSEGRFSLCIYN